ncbi:cyanidin 3-O-rutinoside 5-O-glucosyltransferase-like protein [Carex littledalei]|uniref:Glycosyltransferase n=1 Tax=Carex littledalei TaxID=544730 RepID=A0A833QW78_9POAL|nr:cyanidin 3-O-rutinoside 5-O-glucosyltransferase-like protein [Carex littledalei]
MEQNFRESPQQHFLIAIYPMQSHINPSRHLARKIAHYTGARVTVSTAVSGHRKLCSSLSSPDEEFHDSQLYYLPYSDGYDEGFKKDVHDLKDYMTRTRIVGSESLSALLDRLKQYGQPVTHIIYSILMTWVPDVAKAHGIPSMQFWIQPATVLAIYYYFFRGYKDTIISVANDPKAEIKFPCLPPLKIRDLPSFATMTNEDSPYYQVLGMLELTIEALEKESVDGVKPKVLVNSFDELESDVIKSMEKKLDLISVGPMLASDKEDKHEFNDLFQTDHKVYLEWLSTKPEKSVVYISFGTYSMMSKQQLEEISRCLKEAGWPYLWIVRKDNRDIEGFDFEKLASATDGLVVEWCHQMDVLRHPSVGCFVTHCGWNSTLEALACGVPAVGVPQWTDQLTNARLIEEWGIGVRGEIGENGVIEGKELKRCLEAVMGDGESVEKVREMSAFWKERARVAVAEGGSSERNLRVFLEDIRRSKMKIDINCS